MTQGRPGGGGFDTPLSPQLPPIESAPQSAPGQPGAQPAYRVRDFRPDGRRAALDREHGVSESAPYAGEPQPSAPSDLDYFTKGAPPAQAQAPAPAAAPTQAAMPPAAPTRGRRQAAAAPDSAVDHQPTEHTMSRRELREMRAASEASNSPQPEPIETLLESGPINLPHLAPPPGQSQALADAMAEFDALTSGARGRRASAAQAEVPAAQPEAPYQQPYQQSAPAAQAAPQPAPYPPQEQYPAAPVAQYSAAVDQLAQLQVQSAAQAQAPIPVPLVEPIFIEPTPAARPTGHWSIQAELDDESQPFENTITRTVGSSSGSIATSALVLPSIPQSSVMSPFSATGAIIVTGSISLPQSLGATGAHPHRVDNSDYEEDPFDNEVISTDSAPVRAVNAVSTHTSTRGVIASKKGTGGNRLLTAMVISASTMAVAVVGLMAIAMANGMF